MSFIMDLVMKEGIKYLPNLITTLSEKLGDDEAILIVPSGQKVFVCIGKLAPRIVEVTEDGKYVVSTEQAPCDKYIIPEELDKLMDNVKGNG